MLFFVCFFFKRHNLCIKFIKKKKVNILGYHQRKFIQSTYIECAILSIHIHVIIKIVLLFIKVETVHEPSC